VRAHANDLRVEVKDAALADALESGSWQEAPLTAPEFAFCTYAEKLTLAPAQVEESDVEALRVAGWSDREIHDGCQVIAYFNYINRIADGLGIDPEPGMNA